MGHRTQIVLGAVFVGMLTMAAYLPAAHVYRVSPALSPADRPGMSGARAQTGSEWRTRPVTVALSRASLLVPIGSRAARITTVLTIAAGIAAALTALIVSGLGGKTSAAVASGLGLTFGSRFAAEATSPASNLAEAATCLGIIAFFIATRRTRGWTPSTAIVCGAATLALGIIASVVPFYIAVGLVMSAFMRYAAPYGKAAALMIPFLLPLLNAVGQYGPMRKAVDRNALAAALAEALPAALPVGAVVVGSDSRTDLVHGFWRLGMPAPPLIPPTISAAAHARAKGLEVFALGSSRRTLEQRGLRFATAPVVHVSMQLDEYLARLPFRSIVVQGFGPPGAADLGASEPFYGSIGIVGPLGLRRPLERAHALPVDLRLEAGDPIGSTMTAPVPIRVLADPGGILIDVERRYVVQAQAGMALAVLTSGGTVLAAHRVDTAAPLAVGIDILELEIGRSE